MTRLIRSSSPAAGASPTKTRRVADRAEQAAAVDDLGALEPAARVAEDDDVAAVDLVRLVGELVDEHAVVDEQRVLHRPRRDVERLDEERLDEHRDHQRGDDDAGQLAQERLALRLGRRVRTGDAAGRAARWRAAARSPVGRLCGGARTVLGRHRVRPSVPVGRPARCRSAPERSLRRRRAPGTGTGPAARPRSSDPADDPVDRHDAAARVAQVGPGVQRVGAVVAHQPQRPVGHPTSKRSSDGTSPGYR